MIHIPARLLTQIKHQSILAYPEESCGLLVGKGDEPHIQITRAFESKNITKEPKHDHFEIDPALRLSLQRKLRELGSGEKIVGVYHSHPDGLPLPSDIDISRAHEPDLLWLIISINDRCDEEWGLFKLNAAYLAAQPIPMEVI